MIVVDTLRQDHLECYGYSRDTAPTICRLASEGARLDAVSPTAWTKPAVASLLTGLHPLRHQAIGRDDGLPADATTLAELLSRRGFSTLGVSASGWVSAEFGLAQGFDELQSVPVPGPDTPPNGADLNAVLFPALERLEPPFFLYVHYTDPHDPYDPPMAWDGGSLDSRLREKAPLRAPAVAASRGRLGQRLVRDAIDLYDGEIRSVDTEIGRLLERMEDLGLLQRTLTIVTSDHGEEFQEHGRAGHGHSLYREVTRVPLVLHAPEILEPRSEMRNASLMDVVPTVLHLFGRGEIESHTSRNTPPGSPRFDGQSFARWLLGKDRVTEPPTATPVQGASSGQGEPAPIHHLFHLDLDGRSAVAALGDDRKLILATMPYTKELFARELDPGEKRDLSAQAEESPRFVRLAESLAQRYNQLTRMALPRQKAQPLESLEGLRALGYLDGGGAGSAPRALPRRIRPAVSPPGGFLGWEHPSQFDPCIETAEPRFAAQLYDGWHHAEPRFGGRWTRKAASLVLAPPKPWPPAASLRIVGFRPDRVEVEVSINGETVSRQPLGGGPWTLSIRLKPLPGEPPYLVVRLSSESLVPQEDVGDPLPLGLFVQSVCLSD